MKRYKRLQGQEWHNLKDNGNIKGFYIDDNGTIFTHWLNNEEIIVLKESGE